MAGPAHGTLYTVLYAAALGAVSAGVLTAAHQVLGPRQTSNRRAEDTRQLLAALAVPGARTLTSDAAARLVAVKVRPLTQDSVVLYQYVEGPDLQGIAIRFAGRGYLSQIEGFLGLEPDLATIRGLTITSQGETPGLGGQIVNPEFLNQFHGKTLEGLVLVRELKAVGPHEADAITGATQTTRRFQEILNQTAVRVKELRKDRTP